MTAAVPPPAEIVVPLWLRGIPEFGPLVADGHLAVATTLPSLVNETAPASGAIQVTTGVGGFMDADVPFHRAVVQVDCWAANKDSGKPPWGRASFFAQTIIHHSYSELARRRVIPTQAAYVNAVVHSVQVVREPRRLKSDEANYAGLSLDLLVHYVVNKIVT